jgi:hypothetical protein
MGPEAVEQCSQKSIFYFILNLILLACNIKINFTISLSFESASEVTMFDQGLKANA